MRFILSLMAIALFLLLAIGATDPVELPSTLDWRDNGGNFVTPVKNEDDCDSCWAFAAAALAESYYAIKKDISNPQIDLSEQTLVSCAGDGSCNSGGDIGQALDLIKKDGLPTEDCFPYEGEQENCNRCDNWKSEVTKIPGWSWVDEGVSEDTEIKKALMKGPVTAWFHVHSELDDYTGGVYRCEGDYVGDHFVLLIGWNDADGAWIAKNDWGPDWGDNGFFEIAYDTCGIGQWIAQVGGDDGGDDDDDQTDGCGC